MKFHVDKSAIAPTDANIVLTGNRESNFATPYLSDKELEYVNECISRKDSLIQINQYHRWIFVAVAEEKNTAHQTLEEYRKVAAKLIGTINNQKIEKIYLYNVDQDRTNLLAFAEGMALNNYQFLKYYSDSEKKKNSLSAIVLGNGEMEETETQLLQSLTDAVYHTRDMVNEPVSFMNAEQLASTFEKMGKEAGFTVEVFNKKKIESLKMGGLLAVNKGSIDPPTFTVMEWKPEAARNTQPLVLVGKGVVYDTGGLSLKPTHDSMDYMKCDMSGGATVAGTMYAIARAGLPVHVVGLVPATDNRPDGNAYAPGDVIRMYDGTTVEVLNTDAEGRLILADALGYAKHYNPSLVIDLATLTGSAAMAIGHYGIVGMGNVQPSIMEVLKKSGDQVYERIAEFPFWDEFSDLLKSDIADLKNIGGRIAGSITAGKFLEHFTDYPYIHLDIAGPAFLKTEDSYRGKGGTGTGVRLLFDFIKNMA